MCQVSLQLYPSSSDSGANHIIDLKQNIGTSGRGEEQFHHEGNIFHHFIVLHCLLGEIFSNLDVSNIYHTNQTISIFLGLSTLKLFALASIIIYFK